LPEERKTIKVPPKKNDDFMTLQQFVQNPTGKYSAYFARRDRTIADLEARYLKLLRDNKPNIKYYIYKNKNDYIFHFRIPSEEFGNELYYDTCLHFQPMTEEANNDRKLSNYYLKFFSNSPNFLFTYTYVLNESKMLTDLLLEKCSKTALRERPRIRNPIESFGFEKSCYFAALFIKENGLNDKNIINNILSKWNKKDFISNIKNQESKLLEHRKVKNKKSLEKKEEKKKAKAKKVTIKKKK